MTEIHRYKVVYPAGTFIRTTPAIDADTTGQVLEYGTVFEASKSLFLDGVNYVKLADGRGWVFGNKGDVEVLQLKEVIRTPVKTREVQQVPSRSGNAENTADMDSCSRNGTSLDNGSEEVCSRVVDSGIYMDTTPPPAINPYRSPRTHQTALAKNELIFWRSVRSRCRECSNFEDYSSLCRLAVNALNSQPPQAPLAGQGPARSAWMAASPLSDYAAANGPNASSNGDLQLRGCIAQIAAVTQHCGAGQVADITGLETHLWVLANLGAAGVTHVMSLVVEAANTHFESLTEHGRAELIEAALEVASATKTACAEFSRRTGLLADDVKNFLQRWILIKCNKQFLSMHSSRIFCSSDSLASSDSLSVDGTNNNNSHLSHHSHNSQGSKPRSSSGSSVMSNNTTNSSNSGSSSDSMNRRGSSQSPILQQASMWINNMFCSPIVSFDATSTVPVGTAGVDGVDDDDVRYMTIPAVGVTTGEHVFKCANHNGIDGDVAVVIRSNSSNNSNNINSGSGSGNGGGISYEVERFFIECGVQLKRISTDPDFQFAGII